MRARARARLMLSVVDSFVCSEQATQLLRPTSDLPIAAASTYQKATQYTRTFTSNYLHFVRCLRTLSGSGFIIILRELYQSCGISELRSCVKVEVAVLGSPSLIILVVFVDVKED